MKRCNKCLKEKEPHQFNFHFKAKGIKKKHCIECEHVYYRLHYVNNQRQYIDKAKSDKKAKIAFVRAIKSKTPCTDCHILFPYYVTDFDHLGDKEFNLNSNDMKNVGWNRLKKEIAKCELVCSNCHRIRTHTRRTSIA